MSIPVNSRKTKNRQRSPEPASAVSLIYVEDRHPGIQRQRTGQTFQYCYRGRLIRAAETLDRIRSLAIPPAWENVWICLKPTGHLQATGMDQRGRKQYLYHPHWREHRDAAKYEKLTDFAKALPRIRRRVTADLRQEGLPRSKVLAAIVRLMEKTSIRIGNDEYARSNRSYGLTTLRDHHAQVRGRKIRFEFLGKSRIKHTINLEDQTLARIVRECQDLPGQELFQYRDADGKIHDIRSTDVNDYLREISRGDFTTKDFRTWAGTAMAAKALQELEEFTSMTMARKNIAKAIEEVAAQLGNTKTICRKCYVHPAVIEAYLDRTLVSAFQNVSARPPRLSTHERCVLELIESQVRNHRTVTILTSTSRLQKTRQSKDRRQPAAT